MPTRHFPQIPLLFSTDLTGIIGGKTKLYYQLIQTLSVDVCKIDGLEFLPFRFTYRQISKDLKRFELPILGIHGPLTWNIPTRPRLENWRALAFAAVTPSLKKSLKLTQDLKPNYFLLHEPDLDQPQINSQLRQHLKQNPIKPCLMIENVYRAGSLQKSVQKVKKLQTQTRAGLMLDLAHLLHEISGLTSPFQCYAQKLNSANIDRYWQKLISSSHKALQQVSTAGLHIPLGTTDDGLPFDLLREQHWQRLSQLINQEKNKIRYLVIENQHRETRLALNRKFWPTLLKDKKQKLKTLLQADVL